MRQDRKVLFGAVAAGVVLAGAAGYGLARLTAPQAAKAEAEAAEATPSALEISAATIRASGIGVEAVQAGGLASELLAQATVTAAPGGEALVTARAAGAITRINVRLGDPISAGQALAVVESREAAQIAAERAAAEAKAALAQKTLARERSLFEQRVSPRVDYEQAQAEAAVAAAEVRRSQVAAGAANVTRDGRGVLVVSPISGRVTAMAANLGSFVQPETELFRVADPRRVQVEAALAGADAGRVQPGDRAVVEGPGGQAVEGKVRAVTPSLNPESRTATAVLDVPGLTLQPGRTARVRIFPRAAGSASAIIVPDEAVQAVGGRDVVFVRTAKGFRAQPVIRGQMSAGRTEVVSGLTPGQVIATRNAFLLKAELGKGEGEEE